MQYAPPSPRKIRPAGKFQTKKPSTAPAAINAVLVMNSSPVWNAT